MNLNAVDQTLTYLFEVKIPYEVSPRPQAEPLPLAKAPLFVRDVLGKMIAGRGDEIPVSALPVDGTFPTGTSRWEKRNLALEVPVWDPDICIQCGKCVLVCPHAVIRSKVYEPSFLTSAPASFKSHLARLPEWKGLNYTLQVSTEDCTGCGICVDVCPARNKSETRLKAINMRSQADFVDAERQNWDFFAALPDRDRTCLSFENVRGMQVAEPLFEFSGACAGCGETPYIKLLTQLFGDRLLIANATGCSSIYGGNLPTTPYSVGEDGLGPAWSNSLFEDAAEFGMGFRVSLDKQSQFAAELLRKLDGQLTPNLAEEIVTADQKDAAGVFAQRERVAQLKRELEKINSDEAHRLLSVADTLVRKSVWIIGGDGWGYDIGYGGLDHVLASGCNVKVLLLDTEVYSNTGGQCSKATPLGAVAKFAAGGKRIAKKDLGLISMCYGNIYVASVAMGAKDEHTLKSFLEAEAYDGPALIIAYSHCIAHGINMTTAMQNQKAAVQSGQWLLYRYDPALATKGQNPLHIDSAAPKLPVSEYLKLENRFRMLGKNNPEEAKRLFDQAQENIQKRWQLYQKLAKNDSEENKPASLVQANKPETVSR
jgi:pyruvate-ferredoxin/flavodoxin oxidoreductase